MIPSALQRLPPRNSGLLVNAACRRSFFAHSQRIRGLSLFQVSSQCSRAAFRSSRRSFATAAEGAGHDVWSKLMGVGVLGLGGAGLYYYFKPKPPQRDHMLDIFVPVQKTKSGDGKTGAENSTGDRVNVDTIVAPRTVVDYILAGFSLFSRACELVVIFGPVLALWFPWWYMTTPRGGGASSYLPGADTIVVERAKLKGNLGKDEVENLDDANTTANDKGLTKEEFMKIPNLKKYYEEIDLGGNQIAGGTELSESAKQKRLKWCVKFREALEKAGPVFIKWGQWASTRYDIFCTELCDELNVLTQSSPAHTFEETKEILHRNFGDKILDYIDIEDKPLASGSIGQVYRAKILIGKFQRDKEAALKNLNGAVVELDPQEKLATETVAIKVQHPNLDRVMAIDFGLLEGLASVYDVIMANSMGGYRIAVLMGQFKIHMQDQLDFDLEAENLVRFRANFAPWAFVSFPLPRAHTREVLVESFEPGTSIFHFIKAKQRDKAQKKAIARGELDPSEASGINIAGVPMNRTTSVAEYSSKDMKGEVVAKLGLMGCLSLLKMIILDNFIHADLHPGNILVRHYDSADKGQWQMMSESVHVKLLGLGDHITELPNMCFLDAGLSSAVESHLADHVRSFFTAMLAFDGEQLAYEILALSDGRPVKDRDGFVQDLADKSAVWKKIRETPELFALCRSRDVIKDVLDSCRRHQVELHPTILTASVSTMSLEGWQWELDPSVNSMDHVQSLLTKQKAMRQLKAKLEQSIMDEAMYEPQNVVMFREFGITDDSEEG